MPTVSLFACASDTSAETILLHDHRFRHVLVFGQGRSQNGILVYPAPEIRDLSTFIDDVWPTIVALNKEVPMHSRLVRELVLVAQPDRPVALTDKGTVRGKITLTLYGKEIEQAYKNIEESTSSKWKIPTSFNVESIKIYLTEVVEDVLGRKVSQSDDLFAQGSFTYSRRRKRQYSYFRSVGMDSLLAVRVRSTLLPLVKASPTPFLKTPRNVIYTYPTIQSLAEALSTYLDPSSVTHITSPHDKVYNTIKKYTQGFNPRSLKNGSVVAVTGTTGSVGSFLIAQLLEDPSVRKVYCLNRKSSKTTPERQVDSFKDRGLDLSLLDTIPSRLRFFDVDLSDAKLGLAQADYEDVSLLIRPCLRRPNAPYSSVITLLISFTVHGSSTSTWSSKASKRRTSLVYAISSICSSLHRDLSVHASYSFPPSQRFPSTKGNRKSRRCRSTIRPSRRWATGRPSLSENASSITQLKRLD